MSELTTIPDPPPQHEQEEMELAESEREFSADEVEGADVLDTDDELNAEDELEEEVPDLGPLDDNLVSLVQLAVTTVSEVKAEHIVVVDVRGRTSYCDVLVLCTAITDRQVRAIANQLLGAHKRVGRGRPLGVEGLDSGRWALVDMGDVLVHCFDEPWRGYYDLDGLWMDAPRISMHEVGLTEEGLFPRETESGEE